MARLNHFSTKGHFCLLMSLSAALLLIFGQISLAGQDETVRFYKLRSALEYSGKSQFRNEIETVCTVKEQASSPGKVQYFLSTSDFGVAADSPNSSMKDVSFVIDGRAQHLSAKDKELAFLEKVSNQCAERLKRVTRTNVGKTWKQGFDLSPLGDSVPRELKFTLTAIELKTKTFGEMIAVRALSEPFFVRTTHESGGVGAIQCKINSVYVFDSEFEDIYLSMSVFKATTTLNGFSETLQHSVATCKADATGQQINLSDLGKDEDFKKLVSKIGLTGNLEVTEGSALPHWARAEGIRAAQVANICAAVSCEGALTPVATVCLPIACAVELQSFGELVTTSAPLAAAGGGQGGSGSMFNWFGWNWPTGLWVGGITFGSLGAAGAFDDEDTKYRSPATP